MNTFFEIEELDKELVKAIKEGVTGKVIHHKFCITLFIVPELFKSYNDTLRHKKEMATKALESANWSTYVFLHERPYRLDAFLDIFKEEKCSLKERAELLMDIWTDCEWPNLNGSAWRTLLRIHDEYLMTTEDKARLDSLPETVTVFRGSSQKGKNGISWTLSKEVAEFFAKRFKREDGIVYEKRILKKDIVCLTTQRGEEEILIIDKEALNGRN